MSKKIVTLALFAIPLMPLLAAPTPAPKSAVHAFEPFTGKITANKVRLRSGPDLESKIIQELNKDELLIVTGEQNGFYAVEPLKGMKGYVFRSYILDNIVEGTKVNVRLEPTLEAPILAQLQTGERIEGTISAQNQKWLEIDLPKQTRFYVAKEYILSIGKKELLETLQKRKAEVSQLLTEATLRSQIELQKPFEQINPDFAQNNFKRIIQGYQDFPEYTEKAQAGLRTFQETYLKNKIAYLESQNRRLEAEGLSSSMEKPQEAPLKMTEQATYWDQQEDKLFAAWESKHPGKTRTDFYQEELGCSVTLKGTLEPYNAAVKNRPGDYLLKVNNAPVAFVYSTSLDLKSMVGQHIEVIAIKRPNNHYAYPAYFAISKAN